LLPTFFSRLAYLQIKSLRKVIADQVYHLDEDGGIAALDRRSPERSLVVKAETHRQSAALSQRKSVRRCAATRHNTGFLRPPYREGGQTFRDDRQCRSFRKRSRSYRLRGCRFPWSRFFP